MPDFQYFFDLLLLIGNSFNDDHSVQHVDGYAVRGHVLCASDACDAPVGGHNNHRGHVILQRSVEEGEALNVQHMHLKKLVLFGWDAMC